MTKDDKVIVAMGAPCLISFAIVGAVFAHEIKRCKAVAAFEKEPVLKVLNISEGRKAQFDKDLDGKVDYSAKFLDNGPVDYEVIQTPKSGQDWLKFVNVYTMKRRNR